MKVVAQRVGLKRDERTWCTPSEGYAEDAVEIEQDEYAEIATLSGDLPKSDQLFPLGAPLIDTFKVGNSILRRRK